MANSGRIKPESKLSSILDALQDYNLATYTGEDEGYDYLEKGYFCVSVINPSGADDLYIDMEDGGFTVTYGNWDAHYDAYQNDYRRMMNDIQKFLRNEMYLAVVSQGQDWICSLSIDSPEINRTFLIRQTREFLKSAGAAEFVQQIKKKGALIECSYWNEKRNKEVRLRPGEMH